MPRARDEVVASITKGSAESIGLAAGDQVRTVITATDVMVGEE